VRSIPLVKVEDGADVRSNETKQMVCCS
jgi:hypothetical protein